MEKYRNLKNQGNKKFKTSDAYLQTLIDGEITIKASNGKLSLADDISEKEFKAILTEIVQEKTRYFELFNKAPAGYVILDASYRIIEINETGKNIMKCEEYELLGVPFSKFVSSEYIESFHFFLKNLKAGKKDEDCRLKMKNESGMFIFLGTTGGEDIAENQSFRLLFFNASSDSMVNSNFDHTGKLIGKKTPDSKTEIPAKPFTTEEVLEKLTVLVVDDDEVARIYLAELLKKKCRKILFAKNGKEAVEGFQNNQGIDLILMDIKMPVMDGYSATIKIKSLNKNVVIIAQTAYALASDREKALAAGCNDYLAKPLMKKDLFSVIEKFFNPNNS
ncbi:MAG: response regulator [Mariniphaga sp.]